jgi:hypothetical protein
MGCNVTWNMGFVDTNFNTSFRRKYKTCLATRMFEREKALLPGTQENVARLHKKDALTKKLVEIQRQLTELNIDEYGNYKGDALRKHKHEYTWRCPSEECKGYIKVGDSRCMLCEAEVCSECESAKDVDHVCDAVTIASVKAIRKQTRQCPRCSIPIYKTEGCDQMFCVECHTSFSWKTGEIVKEGETLHNPHYYDWQRAVNGNGAVLDQGNCNGQMNQGLITLEELSFQLYRNLGEFVGYRIGHYVNVAGHMHELNRFITGVTLHEYVVRDPAEDSNLDLRVQFLQNRITEAQFIRKLRTRSAKESRDREIRACFMTLRDSMRDNLNSMIFLTKPEHIINMFHNNNILIDITNQQLRRIADLNKTSFNKTRIDYDDNTGYYVGGFHL